MEVENEYVDPVDRAKLVDGAIKGMVSELDPVSYTHLVVGHVVRGRRPCAIASRSR